MCDQHDDSFEGLLTCPDLSFDLHCEVLPHLLAFGPPERPWLYDANAPSTTVTVRTTP